MSESFRTLSPGVSLEASKASDFREQRKRRHDFYLRNGFRDTFVYKTFDTVTMTIMMMGDGVFTTQDYDSIIDDLKRSWWKGLND